MHPTLQPAGEAAHADDAPAVSDGVAQTRELSRRWRPAKSDDRLSERFLFRHEAE
jgi:hypothetical protein